MYKYLLCWRYLRTRWIALASIVSVTLGVATMIVVNAVMDACYRSAASRQWEPVEMEWRGGSTPRISKAVQHHDGQVIIKQETMPDGKVKMILKDPASGMFSERVV